MTQPQSAPTNGASSGIGLGVGELDYASLNDGQQTAVRSSLEPQIVIAGPGTGKTRVLVFRAAHLIRERGVAPGEVVLITFTTKAAAQLRYRLAELVGPQAQAVQAGTIHHFAYRLVRQYPDPLGLPDDFVIADQAVMESFWQVWCDRNGMANKYRTVMTQVSRFKIGLGAISGRVTHGYRAYQDMLAERAALDYDDILLNARDLLRDHGDVRGEVQGRIAALLVDEFQDTDPVQYVLIKSAMHPERKGLFCVADDDQSIYAFRGAQPKNVRKYIDEFGCCREGGTLHVLDLNYRSHEAIFRCAESVLDPRARIKQTGDVRVVTDGGEPVAVVPCASPEDERARILAMVRERIEAGVRRREIAVFMPWNSLNAACEELFLRMGVPCEVSGTRRLTEVPVVKKVVALLHFLHKHHTEQAVDAELDAFLQLALTPHTYGALRAYTDSTGRPSTDVLRALATEPEARERAGLLPEDVRDVERAHALVANMVSLVGSPDTTLADLVERALPKLAPPLQLLGGEQQGVSDPLTLPSVARASGVLREWLLRFRRFRAAEGGGATMGAADGGAALPRLVVHHTNPFVAQVWTELLRAAVSDGDGVAAEGLCGRSDEEHEARLLCLYRIPRAERGSVQLRPTDLVVTNSPSGFAQKAAEYLDLSAAGGAGPLFGSRSTGGLGPPILHFEPETDRFGTSAGPRRGGRHGEGDGGAGLLGTSPVWPVDGEGAYESPSVRLFKTVQGALAKEAGPLLPAYVMVDLETTGTDTELCRVAQIGALKVVDGAVVDRFERLVALPDDLTEEEAEVLRGVCHFDLADFEGADKESEVWAAFCAFVGEHPIVAYNGQRFDFRVLDRLKRAYAGVEARWPFTYDMLPDAVELFPDRRSYSAESLRADLLRDATPTAHQALADCEDQQRLLAHLQEERSRRSRKLAFEPLLAAVALAVLREPETLLGDERGEEAELFRVGYMWALKGSHPILEALREVIPARKDAVEIIRLNQRFARLTEEAPFLYAQEEALDVGGRIEALIAPFAERTVASGVLRDVLAHVALWGEQAADFGADVVTLSTYHSAKGLEFGHAICAHVHDSAFPDFRCETDEDVAESRRLLYVGMTRAKERLVITYPIRSAYGHRQKPSPFLAGLPVEHSVVHSLNERS